VADQQQLRPDVVAALTRPARFPVDQADALLDATQAERAVASRVLLAEAAEVLAEAGILRPQHTVLDLSLRQVQALAAVLGKLASWWPQPALEQRPLGDVLKVIPGAGRRVRGGPAHLGRLAPRPRGPRGRPGRVKGRASTSPPTGMCPMADRRQREVA
jgi:hypothetical protein